MYSTWRFQANEHQNKACQVLSAGHKKVAFAAAGQCSNSAKERVPRKKPSHCRKKRREIPGYWAGSTSKENRKRLVPKNVSVILGLSASSRPEEMWASYNTPVAPAALTPSNGMTRRWDRVGVFWGQQRHANRGCSYGLQSGGINDCCWRCSMIMFVLAAMTKSLRVRHGHRIVQSTISKITFGRAL